MDELMEDDMSDSQIKRCYSASNFSIIITDRFLVIVCIIITKLDHD